MTDQIINIEPVPDPATPPKTNGIVLNSAAIVYDWIMPIVTLWQENRSNRKMISHLDIKPDNKVLDLGCATGSVALEVAKHLDGNIGGCCIGIDAGPKMIFKARTKIKNLPCRFDIGVAENLPYPDKTFDIIISSYFFHHLNIDDKNKAIKECYRTLKDNGKLLILDVDVPTNLFGWICAKSGEIWFQQPEIRENIDGKLVELYHKSDFKSVEKLFTSTGYLSAYLLKK